MRIYPKTLLTLGITFLCLFILLAVATDQIIGNSYGSLEEDDLAKNVERAQNAIWAQALTADMTAASFAVWDDTFYFLQGYDDSYVERNIVPEGLASMQINMMLFYDTSNELFYGMEADLNTYEEKEISNSLLEYIGSNELLFSHPTSDDFITGILNSPEGPLLISSWPITKTSGDGPIVGTLVVVKNLDSPWIENLEEVTQLDLNLGAFSETNHSSGIGTAPSTLAETGDLNITYLSETSIMGSSILSDINGNPALVLDVVMPRDIYQHGRSSTEFMMYALLIIGVVFGIVLTFSIERSVLSRLTLLSRNLTAITDSKSISSRLEISGNDELHDLSVTINDMLQVLENEVKVRETLNLLESSLESINAGVMVVDRDSRLIMNDKFINMWNINVELISQNDASKVLEYIASQIDITEGTTELLEELENCSNGFSMTLNVNNKAVYDWYVGPLNQNENIVGTIYCVNDITNIKEAERSLILAKVAAETANRAKSDFLTNMSHELRTPLNSIIGFSDLMIGGSVGELADMQKKFLGNISTSGKHLLSIINNVLDISKIEAGKMELNCEPFGISGAIDEVKKLVSPLADEKELTIEFVMDEQLENICADRVKFKQIMFNLANNAIKFTPKGGKVTISALRFQNKVQFTVTDTGIGISEENKSKLFLPFTQLDSNINRLYEGTGLGLSLAKQFVEMHDGKIWFESELGKGTSFTFELPLKTETVVDAKRPI
jgi:signal transduction histidine kinase/sensor domain CHASE-containing protein